MSVTSNQERNSPSPGFAHMILTNGLTISTCQRCMTSIGSPTPSVVVTSTVLAYSSNLKHLSSGVHSPDANGKGKAVTNIQTLFRACAVVRGESRWTLPHSHLPRQP
jgi:hypothetical protein